jgi:hypothetical protein
MHLRKHRFRIITALTFRVPHWKWPVRALSCPVTLYEGDFVQALKDWRLFFC